MNDKKYYQAFAVFTGICFVLIAGFLLYEGLISTKLDVFGMFCLLVMLTFGLTILRIELGKKS